MIKKILIATGGTGGHVFPAYSLAKYLKENYNVILTTDKRGLNFLKIIKILILLYTFITINKKNIINFSILFINYFFLL